MTEGHPYCGLDGKIKCEICQKHCILQMKDDGTVWFSCKENSQNWLVPMVCWEDIAAKVSEESQITDLYLDFLYEVVKEVTICKGGISVKLQRITQEQKSDLLKCQDHWLVYHSLQGDIRAKEQIVLQIAPRLRRHLYALNRKSPLSRLNLEDAEQMVWINVFSYLRSYNSKYRLWTWIKCIATREFYKQFSTKRKTYPSDDAVRIHSDKRQNERPSNINYWESCEYVRSLLLYLTAQERSVVVEHVFKYKSLSVLAREGNLKLSYIRRLYKDALEKLRILILQEDG